MMTKEELKKTLLKGERITLETKLAEKEVPKSIWDTYSAFANTIGGIILLGVDEHRKEKDPSKRYEIRGVENADKIKKDFWNTINSNKVSQNILQDDDVEVVQMDGKDIVCIRVPQASWRVKPVFLNENVYKNTSRARNPRMQNMLRMIGYGENLGSGFPLILTAWKDAGWGEPVLKNKVEIDEVELEMPIKTKNATANGNSNGEIDGDIQLTDRQKDIIAFLRVDGDTTATKMAKVLGISKRTVDREFTFLRKNGFIRKETKDNRSPWVVIER